MARGFEVTTGLVIQQGIFEESSTAKHKIGTRMQLADGRVFYYALNVEALTAGLLCFSKPTHADNTAMVTTTASAAVGAKTISSMTVGGTAITVNEFAEGWLITQKVSGTGNCYKIKSHTSGTSAGTNLDIVLYDPLVQAIATTTEVTFAYNPFYKVLSGTAVVTSPPAGVALRAFTSAYYGWLQTWGVCAIQHDEAGSLTIGMRVHASTEEGAVTGYTTNTETTGGGKIYPHVGYNYGQVAVDAEWTPIMLQLHP
jgi:hypothetical protein